MKIGSRVKVIFPGPLHCEVGTVCSIRKNEVLVEFFACLTKRGILCYVPVEHLKVGDF